jgi:hypothetical protein
MHACALVAAQVLSREKKARLISCYLARHTRILSVHAKFLQLYTLWRYAYYIAIKDFFFLGRFFRNFAGNRKSRYPSRNADTAQKHSVKFEFQLQNMI